MSVSACILSPAGPSLRPEETAFLKDMAPWGMILMGRSCETPDQVRRLVEEIHNALEREALIFIDQEGGRVARLKPPHWPKFPAAAVYGDLHSQDPQTGLDAARLGHRLIAQELTSIGIHADFSPVCDVRIQETHDSIGDRAFAYSADAVTELARAALQGLADGGVIGCLKHMPGQGRAEADSHYGLPNIAASEADLAADFGVFAALASEATMGLTAHVTYSSFADEDAVTVSANMIANIIRDRIGFDGLLITDDLGMDALGGTLGERGVRARQAGCDLLLHCSGFLSDPAEILAEMQEVATAADELVAESAERADRSLNALKAPDGFDPDEAWATFNALLAKPAAGSLNV